MSEIKPKYIRKKCEHGKYSFQCKDCNGISICIHKKPKHICKECGGKGICPHQRIKSNCVECHGINICDHNKRRSRCVECKGASICPHQKIKSRCVECDGNQLCPHKRRKELCVDCKGAAICLHQLRRSRCIDCNGSEICPHSKNKLTCVECHGQNICEHNTLREQCIACHGKRICEHDKRISACIKCTPSSGCQHCHTVSIISSNWKPYCFRCYCVLNPYAVIPRKYKLKEHHVVDALKAHFKEQFTMIFDKPVEGGCSKKRPDISIDFGSHCLMIEIDENRHVNYSCEERRMVELYEDIGFRKIIFLRFNPDGYKEGTHKYISPFRYTRSGILQLDETEFNRRIGQLIERIHAHCLLEPTEQITVEYMFYGDEG